MRTVKLDHETPGFGVKIPKILKKPLLSEADPTKKDPGKLIEDAYGMDFFRFIKEIFGPTKGGRGGGNKNSETKNRVAWLCIYAGGDMSNLQ